MHFICHICGYDKLDIPPWGEDGKRESYDICPCCSTTFGIEDVLLVAFLDARKRWAEQESMKWFDENKKPAGWNKQEQLKNIEVVETRLLPYYLQE